MMDEQSSCRWTEHFARTFRQNARKTSKNRHSWYKNHHVILKFVVGFGIGPHATFPFFHSEIDAVPNFLRFHEHCHLPARLNLENYQLTLQKSYGTWRGSNAVSLSNVDKTAPNVVYWKRKYRRTSSTTTKTTDERTVISRSTSWQPAVLRRCLQRFTIICRTERTRPSSASKTMRPVWNPRRVRRAALRPDVHLRTRCKQIVINHK